MNRSSLDALIAAEREVPPVPAPGVAKKNWRRLERSMAAGAVVPFDVPPPPSPTGGAALLKTVAGKALMGATFAAVAAVAVVVLGSGKDEAETDAVAVAEPAADTAHSQARDTAPRESVEADDAPAPAAVSTTTAPVEHAPAVDSAAAPVAVEPPPRAPSRPRRERRPDAAASDAPSPTGIGRELELIKQAGKAVNRGEHRQALTILSTHRSEFPRGALTEDREALHAIAKCGVDAKSKARTAASFSSRFPRSVHEQRVAEACSIE